MRIDRLHLKNYRCFDEITVDFHPELTVLVAPNGGGKTAILDAVAVALGPFVTQMGEKGRICSNDDSRIRFVPSGTRSTEVRSPFQGITVYSEGTLEGQRKEWKREKRTDKGGMTSKDAAELTGYARHLRDRLSHETEAPDTVLPLIAYYGTGRLWERKKARIEGVINLPRTAGYLDCISSTSRYDRFGKWFRTAFIRRQLGRWRFRENGAPDDDQRALEDIVANVRSSVNAALSPYGECYLDCRRLGLELVVHDDTHSTKLRLDQQSDGVRVMLAMVGDIASRTSLLNPQFGPEAAKKTPGIALIDEVDMHLHPSWQQQVLGSLRKAFPRIQFIVTTHSPQVLTTVSKEHIRILSCDDEGKWTASAPAESPLAREAGDALANIMGTHPRPEIEGVLSNLHAYEQLIRAGKGDSDEARKVKNELDAAGFELSQAEQALFSFLSRKNGES